jgi:hypothetical protein
VVGAGLVLLRPSVMIWAFYLYSAGLSAANTMFDFFGTPLSNAFKFAPILFMIAFVFHSSRNHRELLSSEWFRSSEKSSGS